MAQRMGLVIKSAGDSDITTAISDSMIAKENIRLRTEIARLQAENIHLMRRIERYNALRLATLQPKPRRSLMTILCQLGFAEEVRG